MPQDPESVSLPEPPPQRPAARDAAIEAAMRRFDGVEEPAVAAKPRPTPWMRRPEFQWAMAASLALIVGVPAALIGTRGREGAPPSQPTPAAPAMRMSEPTAQQPPAADVATNAAAEQDLRAPPAPVLQKEQVAPPVTSVDRGFVASPAPDQREEYAAPAAPPPPAPAPPPPALAQKSAEGRAAEDVVVTGTRIPQPNLTSASPVTVIGGERDALAKTNAAKKDRAYVAFLDRLQAAVRDNDPGAVTRLISYPLRVNSGGQSQTYADARSVRRDYDIIFTPHVRQAILAQRADRLFTRDLGVMVGNGEVWFDHVCADESCSRLGPVRITAINR